MSNLAPLVGFVPLLAIPLLTGARTVPAAAALAALVLSLILAEPASVTRFAMVLYSAIIAAVLIAAPARDSRLADQRDALLLLAGALIAYSSPHPALLWFGWALTIVPMWNGPGPLRWLLAAGMAALAAGLLFDSTARPALLTLSILLLKGIFPFHRWLADAGESGSPLKHALFVNSHLGAFLALQYPNLPALAHLALFTAAFAAIVALTESRPRRAAALLSISQASFILAGVQSGTPSGRAGGMLLWAVVSAATLALFLVLRVTEVRVNQPLPLNRFHGLGARMPRLAVFFAVSALSLVGMPGTLGFVAEDLLLHGTLQSYPYLGVILPIATALNAINLMRFFSRLFLGKPLRHVQALEDALPRERLVLSTVVLLIVLFGLWPSLLLRALPAA